MNKITQVVLFCVDRKFYEAGLYFVIHIDCSNVNVRLAYLVKYSLECLVLF